MSSARFGTAPYKYSINSSDLCSGRRSFLKTYYYSTVHASRNKHTSTGLTQYPRPASTRLLRQELCDNTVHERVARLNDDAPKNARVRLDVSRQPTVVAVSKTEVHEMFVLAMISGGVPASFADNQWFPTALTMATRYGKQPCLLCFLFSAHSWQIAGVFRDVLQAL